MGKKGLAFDTIAIMTLGIVALVIMLSFMGVIRGSAKNIFCSAYSNLAEPPAFCDAVTCTSERYKIQTSDTESFIRDIAAHSITCFREKAGCLQEDNVRLCYALFAEKKPNDAIYEYNVTKLLEDEKGCDVLQNNIIINESGDEEIYDGNCGINDQIVWDVTNIFIRDQTLILIEYNESSDKVVVKA
ncbi:MAG: hypothetical protein ABIG84_07400 [archaeon]